MASGTGTCFLGSPLVHAFPVVYLSFPTSNHNPLDVPLKCDPLYIFRFLHQTTTNSRCASSPLCCISFVSYIKPQLDNALCVYIFVVYLSFPTSNHNISTLIMFTVMLYIFRFLHQTTTYDTVASYISMLYIFRFLHQTTTHQVLALMIISCISFVSYIKPQHRFSCLYVVSVVYLSFPTSNHNSTIRLENWSLLYIFRFLHQTTTVMLTHQLPYSCISFVSYIKPQH